MARLMRLGMRSNWASTLAIFRKRFNFLRELSKDNIARFDPKATDQEILQAARLAGAHEIINALARRDMVPR